MAKYILSINGEAYIKDENREVVKHYYDICAKHIDESALSIDRVWFDCDC